MGFLRQAIARLAVGMPPLASTSFYRMTPGYRVHPRRTGASAISATRCSLMGLLRKAIARLAVGMPPLVSTSFCDFREIWSMMSS
jgi:hypothetical protein